VQQQQLLRSQTAARVLQRRQLQLQSSSSSSSSSSRVQRYSLPHLLTAMQQQQQHPWMLQRSSRVRTLQMRRQQVCVTHRPSRVGQGSSLKMQQQQLPSSSSSTLVLQWAHPLSDPAALMLLLQQQQQLRLQLVRIGRDVAELAPTALHHLQQQQQQQHQDCLLACLLVWW
jgi:hypothetical protein